MALQSVASVLLILSTVLALEFPFAYHKQTGGAWRFDEYGRHLMAFEVTLAAVLSLSSVAYVLSALGHEVPMWFRILRVAVFGAVPVVFAWRRWLLAKAQRPQPV